MIYRKNSILMTLGMGLVLLAGCQSAPEKPSQNFQIPSLTGTQAGQNASTLPTATPATEEKSLTQAIESKDLNAAFKAIGGRITQQVLTDLQVAINSGDYKKCAALSSQTDVASCESALVINAATVAKDESICDQASVDSVKQRCHAAFKLPFFKLK